MRTQQAFRQAVYAALTSPQLQYTINSGSPITLPIANVVPQSVELAGGKQAPMPLVAFSVTSRGTPTRTLPDRRLNLDVWCVSSTGPSECTELYEAVRSRLHTADQATEGPSDLSRVSTSSTLQVVVRECVEDRVSPIYFENETQRWFLKAEFKVGAV